MFTRVLLSLSIAFSPLVDLQAQQTSSTFIQQSDAADWIVEALAARKTGDTRRALELLEAARAKLSRETIPPLYANQIRVRLDALIVALGGQASSNKNWGAGGSGAPAPNKSGSTLPDPSADESIFNFLGLSNSSAQANVANNNKAQTAKNNKAAKNASNKAAIQDPLAGTFNNVPAGNLGTNNTTKPANNKITNNQGAGSINPDGSYIIRVGDPNVLKTALGSDDDARALLWWIAAGRMANNAKPENLAEIISREMPGTDLNQFDSNFGSGFGFGGSEVLPGVAFDILSYLGLVEKDYSGEAIALMQMFDGSKLGELADRYMWESARWGALYGAGFGMWKGARDYGPRVQQNGGFDNFGGGDLGGSGQTRKQVLADTILMFANNADYFFKIASLYGVETDQMQKHFVALFLFSTVKMAYKWNAATTSIGKTLTGVDKKKIMTQMYRWMPILKKAGRNYAAAQAKGKDAATDFLAGKIDDIAETAKKQIVDPSLDNIDFPDDPNNPFPPHDPSGGNGDPNDPNNTDPAKKKPRKPRKPQTIGDKAYMIASTVLSGAKGGVFGGAEAAAMALAAKWFFEGMYEYNTKQQNAGFLRLLNSEKGLPYLKLLIHSMNLGQDKIPAFTASRDKNPQVAYIMNLARSAGICSSDDYRALESSEGKLPQSLTQEQKIVRYACSPDKNLTNFNVMMREMMSFNAIADKSIARLRASPIRVRLKMAQVLIQFQYIDGIRTQDEVDFFDEISAKILGISNGEQMHYLQVFSGYVHQAGGLTPDDKSPTGFIVSMDKETMANPYDLKNGPVSVAAPSDILAIDWDSKTAKDSSGGLPDLR